ncbi:MAG: hypothetical protein ACOYK9_06785 [Chlamydiia bacterium]
MGVWLLKKDLSRGFSGFAFFGEKSGLNNTSDPFVDKDADHMAEQCGMKVRGETDYGTTVAVIDCSIEMQKLKFAIEKYWWPSMEDGKLSVRLFDGERNLDVRPSENPLVQPYIEMYGALKKKHDKPGDVKIDEPFNKMHKLKVGQMALRIFNSETLEKIRKYVKEVGVENDALFGIGGAAKIRMPGMVIKYEGALKGEAEAAVAGVFLADEEIDSILRSSEPSSHDDWDSTEKDRIRDAGSKIGLENGEAVEIVVSVNKRIERRLTDARRELTPPPPSEEARIQILDKMLSELFKSGTGGGQLDKDPRPFSISIKTSKAINGKKRQHCAQVILSLKPDYEGDEIKCKVQVEGRILEGPDGDTRLEPLQVELSHDGKTVTAVRPEIECTIPKKGKIQLTANAECGRKEVVRFIVKVINPQI